MTVDDMKMRVAEIETLMLEGDFWDDKVRAQTLIKELNDLKADIASGGPGGRYDRGDAVMTVFSGAGGDDAEDFSRMLLDMYLKFFQKKGWVVRLLHENKNDHGGFRNVTIEVSGTRVYGTLKRESGVHRLVRLSPFNANQLRHTSFSMVEVIPKFDKTDSDIVIPESELEVSIARSGGPGGQNVNKRETAVRMIHIPTKLSVHVTSERSQAQNKEKALELLKGKIYKLREEERVAKEKGMYVSKTTSVEWGNQIRSYVLHPYKMVKDHRTNVETSQVDAVLNDGDIEIFIEAERFL